VSTPLQAPHAYALLASGAGSFGGRSGGTQTIPSEKPAAPINGIASPCPGAVSLAIGVGLDRWRLRRARGQAATPAEPAG